MPARERPLLWSLVIVLAANVAVFGAMGSAAADAALPLDRLVTFATAAVGTSMIAFGGLSWALDGAAAPVGALLDGLVKAPSGSKVVCVLSGGNVDLEQLRGLRWN